MELLARDNAGILDETEKWYWVRVLNQIEMYVMKDDESITPHLIREGFWESWITVWLRNQLTAGTVFYDVGANCGYYSMLAYHTIGMVSSYEPNPEYFEMLKATWERHGSPRSWRLNNVALSDKEGTEKLYIPKRLHGSASFTKMDEKYDVREIEVRTRPLSELGGCGHYLIKIDAEGAEEKIWDGMIPHLQKRVGPNTIMLEYTPGAYSPDFISKLDSFGRPGIRWINGDGVDEPVTPEWILDQTDWVMLVV
jgi:FkbM family methyltransferase